jgi:hypothetical protein
VVDGLAVRLAQTGADGKGKEGANGGWCYDALLGASAPDTNLTSVYLVAGGPKAFHLIYPLGSKSAGVEREDLGIQYTDDDNDPAKHFMAHIDHFSAHYGIVIEHPDAVIRIANIPANLDRDGRATLMERILELQMHLTSGVVNQALFCNQSMTYQIQRAARELQYVVYPEKDPWGNEVMSVNGFKLRRMDVITNGESFAAAA